MDTGEQRNLQARYEAVFHGATVIDLPNNSICRSISIRGVYEQNICPCGSILRNSGKIHVKGKRGDIVIDIIHSDSNGSSASEGRRSCGRGGEYKVLEVTNTSMLIEGLPAPI